MSIEKGDSLSRCSLPRSGLLYLTEASKAPERERKGQHGASGPLPYCLNIVTHLILPAPSSVQLTDEETEIQKRVKNDEPLIIGSF